MTSVLKYFTYTYTQDYRTIYKFLVVWWESFFFGGGGGAVTARISILFYFINSLSWNKKRKRNYSGGFD